MLRSRLALLFALLLTVVDCGGRAPDSGPSRPNDLNEASRKEVEQLVHAADAAHKEWAKTRDVAALARSITAQTRIVELLPRSAEARVSLGNELYLSTDDAGAEQQARVAIELDENNPRALKLLGRVLVQLSRPAEGLPFLQRAISLAPADGECWHKVGSVYFELGDLPAAAAAFYTAGALHHAPLSWLSAAHILHKLKSPKAYPAYWAALKMDPGFHDAWHDLSFSLSSENRHALAEVAARKTVELQRTADNLFGLGNQIMSQKRYEEAASVYREGAALNPAKIELMHNLGYCAHLTGDLPGAVSAALVTARLYLDRPPGAPEDVGSSGSGPMYLAGLSHALRRAGRLDLAVQVARSLEQPLLREFAKGEAPVIINDHIVVHRNLAQAAVASAEQLQAQGVVWGGGGEGGEGAGPAAGYEEVELTVEARKGGEDMVEGAVITYLIGRKKEHYLDLLDSFASLSRHFLRRWPYPVVVFHEGLKPEQMERLRRMHANLRFHRLDRGFLFPPDHVDLNNVPKIIGGHATVGYRHMCRFFSGTMFTYPLLDEYSWFWRLDSDSFILGDILEDPFLAMAKGGYVYGYMGLGREDDYLTTGLWNATQAYRAAAGLSSTNTPLLDHFVDPTTGEWDRTYFYTNFEIGHLPFFRSEAYQAYFRHLDKEGGFYYYRWGDAPIRLLGVALHAPKGGVKLFDTIPYSHKVYVTRGSLQW